MHIMKQPILVTMGNITSSSPPPFITNERGMMRIRRRRDPDHVFFLDRSGCQTPLRGYPENGSSQTRGSRARRCEWERDYMEITDAWIAPEKDTREGGGKRTSDIHVQQPPTATSSEQDHAPGDKNHRNDRNHLPQPRILRSYRKLHKRASSEQDRKQVIHK